MLILHNVHQLRHPPTSSGGHIPVHFAQILSPDTISLAPHMHLDQPAGNRANQSMLLFCYENLPKTAGINASFLLGEPSQDSREDAEEVIFGVPHIELLSDF